MNNVTGSKFGSSLSFRNLTMRSPFFFAGKNCNSCAHRIFKSVRTNHPSFLRIPARNPNTHQYFNQEAKNNFYPLMLFLFAGMATMFSKKTTVAEASAPDISSQFSQAFKQNGIPSFYVINCHDPVPVVLPRTLGFDRVGELFFLDENGRLSGDGIDLFKKFRAEAIGAYNVITEEKPTTEEARIAQGEKIIGAIADGAKTLWRTTVDPLLEVVQTYSVPLSKKIRRLGEYAKIAAVINPSVLKLSLEHVLNTLHIDSLLRLYLPPR